MSIKVNSVNYLDGESSDIMLESGRTATNCLLLIPIIITLNFAVDTTAPNKRVDTCTVKKLLLRLGINQCCVKPRRRDNNEKPTRMTDLCALK